MRAIIERMFAGQACPFGAKGASSAIDKQIVPGPWRIGATGLAGDEQADRRHHGGAEKALHHYGLDHYRSWARELPAAATLLEAPPAFGENLSSPALSEADVCVGDVLRAGTVTLQVSQGRQPCWKLNVRFGVPDMALRVQRTGRTGWYYRVLEAGIIEPGDALHLVDRPQPAWPLSRILDLLYRRTKAFDELDALSRVPELAESWRSLAARRVASRSVERWTARLREITD